MSCEELQQEELEVLESIYEGDECFKQVSDKVFQYKIESEVQNRSFLVEVSWGDSYPEELPNINLDAFFNKHILVEVKEDVVSKLKNEAEMLIGCAMTYTVFEWAKENATELMSAQPETAVITMTQSDEISKEDNSSETSKPKIKKEQLTKAQKRKITNRLDNKGELPRGHDWVDVIKHLSQTGKNQHDE